MKKVVKIWEDYELPYYGKDVKIEKVPTMPLTDKQLDDTRIKNCGLPKRQFTSNYTCNDHQYRTMPIVPPYYGE